MALYPFRFTVGEAVRLADDLVNQDSQYVILPKGEKGYVGALTLDQRGTFASVMFGQGRRYVVRESQLLGGVA